MEPLDIYVLGAGASFVHGAPLTNQILEYAFNETGIQNDPRLEVVKAFLKDIFHFDANLNEGKSEDYPGLVDVLSVVDMALDRKESLAPGYGIEKLRKVREGLEYAIFRALEHSLSYQNKQRPRSKVTKQLVNKLSAESSVIISLNYDVIIDIALSRRFKANFTFEGADAHLLQDTDHLGIDYGVEFANLEQQEDQNLFRLYKLHGSFNWLWSSVTGNIYFGGLSKAIAKLYDDQSERALNLEGYYLSEQKADLQPILITPTHLKDLRNVHIGILWRKAEEALRRAKRITFIGYSLPGDDLHIKYLFKRAIVTRHEWKKPEITVVDYAEGTNVTSVQENYMRFFGKDVIYYRKGFENYVKQMGNDR
jgi:hypothetical protein